MQFHVWSAAKFFLPYFISAAVIALAFALAMHPKFKANASESMFYSAPRSWTYFFLFAAFGVVIAYFLSLGLKQDGNNWVNPLVNQFATPLIALLTAAVGYFAKQAAPDDAKPVVAAGVTCFMIECVLCYEGFFRYIRDVQ